MRDAELVGGVLQDLLDGQGVGERHHGALGPPGPQTVGHLDQLVGVTAAQLRAGDGLGLGSRAVQHDRLRVVEARGDIDPARRPEDPGLTGQCVPQ
jgi:hypothetical protein